MVIYKKCDNLSKTHFPLIRVPAYKRQNRIPPRVSYKGVLLYMEKKGGGEIYVRGCEWNTGYRETGRDGMLRAEWP